MKRTAIHGKTWLLWIASLLAGLLALAGTHCSSNPGDAGDPEPVASVEYASTTGATKINCGGSTTVAPFIKDTDYSGGSTITRTNPIDTSAVVNPAPTAVYQSQRYGNFTYTLPGFAAGSWNRIRLHFADTHWTKPGSRVFNVSINGTPVLTKFDIIRTVGAGNKALVEQFTMPASSTGSYVIKFTTVTDAATVSGIEIAAQGWAGTPTQASGTAYATQCAQQLVPLPPNFGGGGTCAACFSGSGSCIGCSAGAWTYSGQIGVNETQQSFNDDKPVDIFYWESTGTTPGMCMMAARTTTEQNDAGILTVDFIGVICQAASGAVCFWDQAQPSQFQWVVGGVSGHIGVPTPAAVITSTTSIPTPPAFVGGADLISTSTVHGYQNACSDCHAGRNAFNNHPGTATDLNGRGLVVSPTDWFPVAWPSPIVPAWDPGMSALGSPWPENPGPQPTTGFSGTVCFGCHNGSAVGGAFPMPSAATPNWCGTLLNQAVNRVNDSCPNTYPWSPTGSPGNPTGPDPDINCPTGAMPPSSYPPAPNAPSSDTDPFAVGMLSHPTGQCFAEFRTQFLPPPGGGALLNGFQTLSTAAYNPGSQAITFGVGAAGTITTYDPNAMQWTATNQTAAQLSLGADGSVWAIKRSGNTAFVCATSSASCKSGNCSWTCDASGNSGNYAQIVAGSGSVIWAVDGGKYVLWAYWPTAPGQYTPDHFIAMGEWPYGDPIAQITEGGDSDMWILSVNGNISHQVNGGGFYDSIPSPPGGKVVSIAAANANDVWVASSSGLFHFLPATNTWEQHCLASGGCSASSFTTVVAGGDSTYGIADVWALDSAGTPYRVDRTQGAATNSIIKVPGVTLTQIAVGGQGDVLGMNSAGTVYSFQ
jgi:hypothetical protein